MASVEEQLIAALEAASNPVSTIRQQGEANLQGLRSQPESFLNACANLLTAPSVNIRARQLAGYQLKNNLLYFPANNQSEYLQQTVCGQALRDGDRNIRKVASSIISLAVRENIWAIEAVVANLISILTSASNDLNSVHGAIRCLSQIVDDCVALLDMRRLTGDVIRVALPLLSNSTFGNDINAVEIRAKSYDIMAEILDSAGMSNESFSYVAMKEFIASVMEACFTTLQSPPSLSISAKCVRCVVSSLVYHEMITPEVFKRITELMFAATTAKTGQDEELRIEATEFWKALLYVPSMATVAVPAIERIIPCLIEAMVYSDMEMAMLQANESDWQVPDKIEDIRPRHYQARMNSTNEEDDDDAQGEEVEEWNLRRVSALTLDEISEYYGEPILIPVLSTINEMMQPGQPWHKLEAAILALGAICDGCFDSMTEFLPQLSERLLQILEDPSTHFLVVTITLWTSTQIGPFMVSIPDTLRRLLFCILNRMQNPSKLVQEAATAALEKLAQLCDEGQLNDYAAPIVERIAQCFGGFQLKNRVLLFETSEVICDVLSDTLRSSHQLAETLITALGSIWMGTPDDSPMLYPFFKCMSSVCTALGPAMQPMGPDIFNRAYRLLSNNMQIRCNAIQSNMELPEPELVITSAELLSGLFDGLGSSLEPLLAQNSPGFIQVVLALLNDEDEELQRSGFGLVGDVVKCSPFYIQQALQEIMTAIIRHLSQPPTEQTYPVISNTSWALCCILENEIETSDVLTVRRLNAIAPAFVCLTKIIIDPSVTPDMRNMAENICLCIGVILYLEPDLAMHTTATFGMYARNFCLYMRNIKDVPNKSMALIGFLNAALKNILVVNENLVPFLDLASSFSNTTPEVAKVVKDIFSTVKQNVPQTYWAQGMGSLNEASRKRLFQIFDVQ